MKYVIGLMIMFLLIFYFKTNTIYLNREDLLERDLFFFEDFGPTRKMNLTPTNIITLKTKGEVIIRDSTGRKWRIKLR